MNRKKTMLLCFGVIYGPDASVLCWCFIESSAPPPHMNTGGYSVQVIPKIWRCWSVPAVPVHLSNKGLTGRKWSISANILCWLNFQGTHPMFSLKMPHHFSHRLPDYPCIHCLKHSLHFRTCLFETTSQRSSVCLDRSAFGGLTGCVNYTEFSSHSGKTLNKSN